MEITDVPLFDKIFSFQKLALLQAAALQFDVLALTGLRDENEVFFNLYTLLKMLNTPSFCYAQLLAMMCFAVAAI
jgi:hypothetical protein